MQFWHHPKKIAAIEEESLKDMELLSTTQSVHEHAAYPMNWILTANPKRRLNAHYCKAHPSCQEIRATTPNVLVLAALKKRATQPVNRLLLHLVQPRA